MIGVFGPRKDVCQALTAGALRSRSRPTALLSIGLAISLVLGATMRDHAKAADSIPLRGVNVGLFEGPDNVSGESPDAKVSRIQSRYDLTLATLAASHMNLVRLWLPVVPPQATAATLDQQHRLLLAFLDKAAAHAIKVVVVLHPFPGVGLNARAIQADPKQQADFVNVLHRTSDWIADAPALLAFEPMNEPPDFCDAPNRAPWSGIQERFYQDLRKTHPKMGLVVTGPCWSSVKSLASFDPSPYRRDKNVYYTAHYYDPVLFTHQGAGLKGGVYDYLSDLPYPYEDKTAKAAIAKASSAVEADAKLTEENRGKLLEQLRNMPGYYQSVAQYSKIRADFDALEAWRARNAIAPAQVLLGEFGVHRRDPVGSGQMPRPGSENWLHAVRHEAESHHFGWAVWDFDGGFSILCNRPKQTICPSYEKALLSPG